VHIVAESDQEVVRINVDKSVCVILH